MEGSESEKLQRRTGDSSKCAGSLTISTDWKLFHLPTFLWLLRSSVEEEGRAGGGQRPAMVLAVLVLSADQQAPL